MRYERSFPFVAFLDLDVVIAPAKIHLCEELTTLQLVNKLREQGKWIIIFNSELIYVSVILHHVLLSILFWNKEDERHLRADRGPDISLG